MNTCSPRGLALRLLLSILGLALLVACGLPGRSSDAARVVKIGLIAPFEGVGRPLGYAVLPAVRAVIAEANASGELGGYRVALVALNDDLDPATAASQARALAQDSAIMAVLGPFGQDTAATAAPILNAAGISTMLAAPSDALPSGVTSSCPPTAAISAELVRASADLAATAGWPPLTFFPGNAVMAADELLVRRAGGWQGIMVAGPDVLRPWFIQRAGAAAEGARTVACTLSGPLAVTDSLPEVSLAGDGTKVLLQALAADLRAHGQPSRAGVAEALGQQSITPQLVWYQVVDGKWKPVPSP